MIRLLPKSGKAQLAVMESDLLRIQLTNFGAAIFSVQLKKENGELEDLVLTCDSLESFLENRNFYGATVGRVVNRIRGGHAEICGTAYQLECNEGRNSAHGGTAGFAWRFWDTEVGRTASYSGCTARTASPAIPAICRWKWNTVWKTKAPF